jgi:hypothetical protein
VMTAKVDTVHPLHDQRMLSIRDRKPLNRIVLLVTVDRIFNQKPSEKSISFVSLDEAAADLRELLSRLFYQYQGEAAAVETTWG